MRWISSSLPGTVTAMDHDTFGLDLGDPGRLIGDDETWLTVSCAYSSWSMKRRASAGRLVPT